MTLQAYQRWLHTQSQPGPEAAPLPPGPEGGLVTEPWLYARRAPGNACLTGLADDRMGSLANPKNPQSKGCGTVMRSAPFGLLAGWDPQLVFQLAIECAVLTHGHPTGYLAAGAFAVMVHATVRGNGLQEGVLTALGMLAERPGHEETTAALRRALEAVSAGPPTAELVESLGAGWVAEEALAIGVYCALVAEDVRTALLLAVNHSGDSDSTGSICGNLLGALHGETVLPGD
jgi:ADP-ribosylglycohydrolase